MLAAFNILLNVEKFLLALTFVRAHQRTLAYNASKSSLLKFVQCTVFPWKNCTPHCINFNKLLFDSFVYWLDDVNLTIILLISYELFIYFYMTSARNLDQYGSSSATVPEKTCHFTLVCYVTKYGLLSRHLLSFTRNSVTQSKALTFPLWLFT